MSGAADDPCQVTARYFDGEAGGDEAAALDHLATCAACQRELTDLVGVEVALGRGGATAEQARPLIEMPAPARGGRRVWMIGAGVAALAAAVVLYATTRPGAVRAPDAPVVALGPTRTVEARLSAPAFDQHRPLAVVRGGPTGESVPLATMAALERAGDGAGLIAAQVVSGDLVRARAALDAQPAEPARDSDRAALELTTGHPVAALAAADRALAAQPELIAAHWNRGLALRDLGFSMVAAEEFERVAARGEPGWSDEARTRARAIREPVVAARDGMTAFRARAEAMLARTGPPLDADAVRAFPGMARLYFLDGVRSAASRAEVEALAPLAQALDAATGSGHAMAALTAAAARDFAVRGPLGLAYRDLVLQRVPVSTAPALRARLVKAGDAAIDLRVGLMVLTAGVQAELPWFASYAKASGDPWFELLAAREQARALDGAGAADRAEVALATALGDCDARLWAYRCAQLAFDLAALQGRASRFAEASERATQAMQLFAAAGERGQADNALSYVAELERGRGRWDVAAVAFQEVLARAHDRDCNNRRYAQLGLALIAVDRGQRLGADAVPEPTMCDLAPTAQEVIAVWDRGRASGQAADVAIAQRWLGAAASGGDARTQGLAAVIGQVIAEDPDATRALGAIAVAEDEEAAAVRAWGFAIVIDRLAARAAWSDAVAVMSREVGVAPPTACALFASTDHGAWTLIALDAAGQPVGARGAAAADTAALDTGALAPGVVAALASCPQVQVVARPPLHGQASLLPAARPWAFVRGPATAPIVAAARTVVIGDALPPPSLGLPALAPLAVPAGTDALRAAAATPDAVLAALADATYAELHVHGQVDLAVADASFLALSPGADGTWSLTAGAVRKARLRAAPVVVLAACRAAVVAPFQHARWSLPDAFLAAGARAVIAPAVDIPDAEAGPFFDQIRARILGGEAPAVAVAAVRAAAVARGQAWAASVVVFE